MKCYVACNTLQNATNCRRKSKNEKRPHQNFSTAGIAFAKPDRVKFIRWMQNPIASRWIARKQVVKRDPSLYFLL